MTPAYRAKPAVMWAGISEDEPPQIYGVAFYREHLQANLRHVRVLVTPVTPKYKPAIRRRKGETS